MFTLVITRGSKSAAVAAGCLVERPIGLCSSRRIHWRRRMKTIPSEWSTLLSALLPLATGLVATKYHLARDGDLVGFVSVVDFGALASIKYRFATTSPVLIFTVMLSLAYSIFQGNVGNAYRQRSQLLVFYFIFVAVGYVLMLEKREERNKRDPRGA